MKTLLRIDASIRLENSHTRTLTGHFEAAWLRANPDGTVVRRCLAAEPVPHLSQGAYEAFDAPGGRSGLSDALIDELRHADHILIGSPLYNLGPPSALKAYFDHVVRAGLTFEAGQGGYRGLLDGKRATLITARGGVGSSVSADDFQSGYLRQILAFIGIACVETVALEGTGGEQGSRETALNRAKREIDRLCGLPQDPVWVGDSSDQDRIAIGHLRAGQADAIVAGDANAYAALCTEDIQLLIPAHELISGKGAFLQAEEALFRRAKFMSFRKIPLRVERSGDLAIEVGRQEAQMQSREHAGGVFSARQKYTHVFRRTDRGWRFALLMSNPSE